MADVIKVDKRGEEVKRRDEEKKIEEKRRQAEQRRREEERRSQIQVEDRQKRPVGPEKTPVWQQRERDDDWFNLMGVYTKDSGMHTRQNKHAVHHNRCPTHLIYIYLIDYFSLMSVHR